jgi:di/tripeptidase
MNPGYYIIVMQSTRINQAARQIQSAVDLKQVDLDMGRVTIHKSFKLKFSGLHGGHSGIDIIKQRASANKLIARSLQRLSSACDIRLVSMKGGTAHNAIARDA